MSHRERIERALALETSDRIPFGFWWHFPNRDRAPRRLAELHIALLDQNSKVSGGSTLSGSDIFK